MSTFEIKTFAAQCEAAMDAADDRQAAAAALLQEAIDANDPEAMIATLNAAVPPGASVGELIVYASTKLTMLFARIPAHFQSGIHNHTVFAIIGQLKGEELNTVYEQKGKGLEVVGQQTARPGGDLVLLPADAIHGIANTTDETAYALHLYGGDLAGLQDERTLWDQQTHDELPFSFPALVGQSVAAMKQSGNDAGLEALVEAIPSARPLVEVPVGAK